MRASETVIEKPHPFPARVGWFNGLAKRMVLMRLGGIREGRMTLIDGAERHEFGSASDEFSVGATIRVLHPRFYNALAFGGSIGAGESYMAGHWQCDSLTSAVRILLRNYDVLSNMDDSAGRITAPLHKMFHWLHRNTKDGSRKNIAAHYDLGNDMFQLFLDETMMYSCGVFDRPDSTLEEASMAKIDRICRKLDLSPADHILEIGTGWGGFALHAAKRYGCRVTTTTISREQHALAVERVETAGLGDRITVLCQDYRDLDGQYDKLVSIEMIEAVGYEFFDNYFEQCSRLLKPEGMMLLQAITIADQRYEAARHDADFIQRYIFPGGCLPSVAAINDSIARVTNMRLFHLEDIGPHYATTLRHWRDRFIANVDAVRALGYPKSFVRMWEFYFCYCEGGFLERSVGTVQALFTKPSCRRDALLPPLQAAVATPTP
ncbi:MAG: class I SAM-dependent methyltransferase [Pseudomonadota bacterium]|nr:MAG: class I SAM-dependent methyltransferase [Pseudomonadota bacterium]